MTGIEILLLWGNLGAGILVLIFLGLVRKGK